MHSAPTLGPTCAHTAPCRRNRRSYHGPPPAVSWSCRTPCRRAPARAFTRCVAAPYAVLQGAGAVSQPWLRCITTQSRPPQPQYKILYHGPPLAKLLAVSGPKRPPPATIQICITTPPVQAMRARTLPHTPYAGRPYRGLTTPCRGRGLAVSCPCLAYA